MDLFLQNHLCKAVECVDFDTVSPARRSFNILECRVAVAPAENLPLSVSVEADLLAGSRNETTFFVKHSDGGDADVSDSLVCGLGIYRLADSLYPFLHNLASVPVACGLHIAGLVCGRPFEMSVLRHLLALEPASVHCQLHLVTVAIDPDRNILVLVSVKIPVRKYVQYRLFRPPSLEIISLILRESAIVEDTEFGAGRWKEVV